MINSTESKIIMVKQQEILNSSVDCYLVKDKGEKGLLELDTGKENGDQFSSVQSLSCVWLFATPWTAACQASIHRWIPEFTQTHVHWVSDAIQPTHPLSSPSPPAFNLPKHQSLFRWVISSHQVTKVLEFQLQHQSLQWIFRTDFL